MSCFVLMQQFILTDNMWSHSRLPLPGVIAAQWCFRSRAQAVWRTGSTNMSALLSFSMFRTSCRTNTRERCFSSQSHTSVCAEFVLLNCSLSAICFWRIRRFTVFLTDSQSVNCFSAGRSFNLTTQTSSACVPMWCLVKRAISTSVLFFLIPHQENFNHISSRLPSLHILTLCQSLHVF